jgi:hypothetical protein
MFFYPFSAKWRRGTDVLTMAMVTIATVHISIMFNFGKHEHVFSPLRRYVIPKIDAYFKVSPEELAAEDEALKPLPLVKPGDRLRR